MGTGPGGAERKDGKMDREKVIRGLECCTSAAGCFECPYSENGKGTDSCQLDSTRDALELLKGQEPLKQKMWNALYAEEDKLENHYIGTDEIDKWFVDYRPFLQRGFEIAIEVIAAHEEGR